MLSSFRKIFDASFWRLVLVVCLLATACTPLPAQVDSLVAALVAAEHDTVRCNILEDLIELAPMREQSRYNQMLKSISTRGFETSESPMLKRFYLGCMSDAISNEGYDYMYQGNPDSALPLFQKSLRIDQWLHNLEGMSADHNNVGFYYEQKGNLSLALENYEFALEYGKQAGDVEGNVYALGNIASLHEERGNLDLAMLNYRLGAAGYEKLGESQGIGRMHNYMAHVFIMQQNWDSAAYHCRTALAAMAGDGPEGHVAVSHSYLAYVWMKQQQWAAAQEEFAVALTIYDAIGFAEGRANTLLDMAEMYQERGVPAQAQAVAQEALEIGRRLRLPPVVKVAATSLATSYASLAQYRQAFEMQALAQAITDSLEDGKIEKALLRAQFEHQNDLRAAADSLRNLQSQQLLALKIDRQSTQNRLLLVIVALVLLLAVIVFNRLLAQRRQRRMIEAANQDLQRLHLLNQKVFSVISHDFRGPILSLNILLDSFKSQGTHPALLEFVNAANAEVRNAKEMLDNLLNWAKVEISMQDGLAGKAALGLVSRAVCQELALKVRDKSITIHSEFESDAQLAIPPDILRIVLRNLLSNAIKFSHPGHTIRIIHNPHTGALQVCDEGIGMAREVQKHLFQQNIETALGTDGEEGFGIGLYIVGELLHKYGHQITVHSALGQGTCFTISPK